MVFYNRTTSQVSRISPSVQILFPLLCVLGTCPMETASTRCSALKLPSGITYGRHCQEIGGKEQSKTGLFLNYPIC